MSIKMSVRERSHVNLAGEARQQLQSHAKSGIEWKCAAGLDEVTKALFP